MTSIDDVDSGAARLTQRQALALGATLFVIAAIVRLSLLHTARFGGDEALFFRLGMDIVEGKGLPLLGTQITDGAAKLPGPAFLYLMAVPLVVWRAPEAQFAFTEVLGAVAVVVWWATARRLWGERAAVVVGVFGACSPWAVLYADRTWNPNVLPLFVGIAVWCAWRLYDEPRHRAAAVLLWPALAVLPQLHLSTPVAIAGVLVVVVAGLVGRTLEVDRRAHAVGLALAALLYVPLLVHEVQTDMNNTRLMLTEVFGIGAVPGAHTAPVHPWGFLWVPVYTLRLLSLDVSYHELSGYWGGPDERACLRALIDGTAARPFHVVRAAALAVSLAVSVAAWALAVRDRTRAGRVAVVSAVVVVVANTVLMGVAAKQVFGHYVITQLPFLLLVLGAAVRTVLRHREGIRAIGLAALVIVCVGGVEAAVSVSRNVDAKIGLAAHRAAATVMKDDADRAALAQSEPIALYFALPGVDGSRVSGVRGSHYDWHIFANRALGLPWHFDNRAATRRYALTPLESQRPRAAVGDAVVVEHATLWRLR